MPGEGSQARRQHRRDGGVDVVDRLTYELDDTPFMVPSDLLIDRVPGVRRRI